jgi:hypothetical protein
MDSKILNIRRIDMTRYEFICMGCQDDLDGGMDPDPHYWGEQYDFYMSNDLDECSSVTILWLSGEYLNP